MISESGSGILLRSILAHDGVEKSVSLAVHSALIVTRLLSLAAAVSLPPTTDQCSIERAEVVIRRILISDGRLVVHCFALCFILLPSQIQLCTSPRERESSSFLLPVKVFMIPGTTSRRNSTFTALNLIISGKVLPRRHGELNLGV